MTGYYRAMANRGKAINDGSKTVTLAGGEMVGGQVLWVKLSAEGKVVARHGYLPESLIGKGLVESEASARDIISRR